MYISRKIETAVQRISQTFPVLMVTGPRQSGKTASYTRSESKRARTQSGRQSSLLCWTLLRMIRTLTI